MFIGYLSVKKGIIKGEITSVDCNVYGDTLLSVYWDNPINRVIRYNGRRPRRFSVRRTVVNLTSFGYKFIKVGPFGSVKYLNKHVWLENI